MFIVILLILPHALFGNGHIYAVANKVSLYLLEQVQFDVTGPQPVVEFLQHIMLPAGGLESNTAPSLKF